MTASASDLVLERDIRGSLVHVRNRATGECVGCVEAGLFEVLRELVLGEARFKESSTRDLLSQPGRVSYVSALAKGGH
jgi:hypothetical protein